ncbi:hypothetical protein ERJ75_000396500 [Trypanosoma vivax]|nr:hypothetical protein ERJ75_000396500 [Trypanosoma vivax]
MEEALAQLKARGWNASKLAALTAKRIAGTGSVLAGDVEGMRRDIGRAHECTNNETKAEARKLETEAYVQACTAMLGEKEEATGAAWELACSRQSPATGKQTGTRQQWPHGRRAWPRQ